MKANSIEEAKNKAKELLQKYKDNHEYSYLEKALNLDNTNSLIIFEYLHYLKQNDQKKFIDELKRYKFFLNEDFCNILEIEYINPKEEIINLIDLFQNIIRYNKDTISFKNLTNILEKYYPRNMKEIFEQKNEKRINNLPSDNTENDTIFFLQ